MTIKIKTGAKKLKGPKKSTFSRNKKARKKSFLKAFQDIFRKLCLKRDKEEPFATQAGVFPPYKITHLLRRG